MTTSPIARWGVNDQTFTNLLASAYSLQQRQDQLKLRVPARRSDELLSAVRDTQRLIWHQAIHPETALQLIASRSQKLCGAAGTAIAFLDGESLEYRVATGIATEILGLKIFADASASFQQLRSQSFTESTTWRDKALGTRLVANFILSVPIRRKGVLVGCLQVFSRVGQFGEDAIYACELMATFLAQLLDEAELPQNGGQQRGVTLESAVATKVESRQSGAQRAAQVDSLPSEMPQSQKPNPAHKPIVGSGSQPKASSLRAEFGKNSRNQHEEPEKQLEGAQNVGLPLKGEIHASGSKDPTVTSKSTDGDARPRTWTRVTALIYPVLVLLFVGIAKTFCRTSGWPLELANIFIVAFTAVEIRKRWLSVRG
jgi:hypothetical protein